MIVRTLKLRLKRHQEDKLNGWLWNLTGVYNWACRKIDQDSKDNRYHSEFDLQKMLFGHSEKMGIPCHTLRGVASRAHTAWTRYFKKISGRPKLKGVRNKLRSIPFTDPIKKPKNNSIRLVGIGNVRFVKQALPDAKIKCGAIVKKRSGWYLFLFLDCDHKFPVRPTTEKIGIDFGFSSLLTLSNGEKIENPRELRKGERRLSQAIRGSKHNQSSRIFERQANRRRDRNHKISRLLVHRFQAIYYGADNLAALTKRFSKSIAEAGHGQLIRYLTYKCRTGGRELVPINSKFTTKTCSSCLVQSGPTGLSKLEVRNWECASCGKAHDRDINAAVNILNFAPGRGVGVRNPVKKLTGASNLSFYGKPKEK